VRSDKTLRKRYVDFNRRFFDGMLPDNIGVRWATDSEADQKFEAQYEGWIDPGDVIHRWIIVLARECREDVLKRLSTLAHEMIHIATDCRDDHGPAFEKWRQLISDRGFFKKSAVRRGITMF
jgi:hypothetical protein